MSPVEDIARGVGSYAPRGAGAGNPYFSGGVRVDAGKTEAGGTPSVGQPADEYIPSNAPANAETEAADAADAENAQQQDENRAAEGEFTPEQQRAIADLKTIDREVRAHEQAHVSVGGSYILGGPLFEYESGPDRKRYAVGGEVSIDSSPERDNPEATIAKMQVVRAAALAPADPSAQDRAVATAAASEESRARSELNERKAAEARGDRETKPAQNADDNQTPPEDPAQRQSRIVAGAVSAYTAAQQIPTVNFAA
jgi:hypothetical protein